VRRAPHQRVVLGEPQLRRALAHKRSGLFVDVASPQPFYVWLFVLPSDPKPNPNQYQRAAMYLASETPHCVMALCARRRLWIHWMARASTLPRQATSPS
jgi:hypothetical protein